VSIPLIFYSSTLILDSWSLSRDGWAVGPAGELLFYVPSFYQAGLSTPQTKVIGEAAAELDISNMYHGTAWEGINQESSKKIEEMFKAMAKNPDDQIRTLGPRVSTTEDYA